MRLVGSGAGGWRRRGPGRMAAVFAGAKCGGESSEGGRGELGDRGGERPRKHGVERGWGSSGRGGEAAEGGGVGAGAAVQRAFHSPLNGKEWERTGAAGRGDGERERRGAADLERERGVAGPEVAKAVTGSGHTREAVKYEAGMRTLRELGCEVLLEVGGTTLTGMGRSLEVEESGVPSLVAGDEGNGKRSWKRRGSCTRQGRSWTGWSTTAVRAAEDLAAGVSV